MSSLGVRLTTASRALAARLVRQRGASPVRRILVAHYLLLGDTVLLAPLLKALEALHPDAERVVLARPAVAVLFDRRPYGVRCMILDRRDAATRRRVIDSGPYDLAIVPDDNRYAWLARAAGARRVVAFAHDRPSWKNWMVDEAVTYPERPASWADLAAASLAHVECVAPYAGEWPRPAASAVELPSSPFVVLHVGASTPLKRWMPARWGALAAMLRDAGLTIVWSAGRDERDVVAAIGAADGIAAGDLDVSGRYDLAQLWHLLAAARLLVCPDTGIAHLARLIGTPTVALFGPASAIVHGPGAFWADAKFAIVTDAAMPCRDQRVLFRREVDWVRRCGRRFDATAAPAGASDPRACGRALCMEAIAVDQVRAAIDRVLACA